MAEGGKYLNMKYWELLKEENEAVAERHELAMERIGHMKEEATVGEPYRAFFGAHRPVYRADRRNLSEADGWDAGGDEPERGN